jgi:hypothetical protein
MDVDRGFERLFELLDKVEKAENEVQKEAYKAEFKIRFEKHNSEFDLWLTKVNAELDKKIEGHIKRKENVQ